MSVPKENIIILIIVITITLFLVSGFIVSYVLFYFRKQKRNELEKNEITQKFQETLLLSQLEIKENTLKNISEEIHDNIGQSLSLAKLTLNMIDPGQSAETSAKIKDTKELISQAILDLRDLSRSFHTDHITSHGLVASLNRELEIIQKSGKYSVSIHSEGVEGKLQTQHSLIIFRIIQEILQNIIKHADANKIDVFIINGTQSLKVIIRDDGKGFNPKSHYEGEPTFGLGIRNMNSRAALIGGSVLIESEPGIGTTVTVEVPVSSTL